MGISLKGWSTRRSLSPVTIQDAFAVTASSKNLLSLESRQEAMETLGLIILGQNFLKDFLGKSVLFSCLGYFIHSSYKIFFFIPHQFLCQTDIYNPGYLKFIFTCGRTPIFSGFTIDFYNNSFHSLAGFTCKDTKNCYQNFCPGRLFNKSSILITDYNVQKLF